MSNSISHRTLVFVGALMAVFGIALYSQMGMLVELGAGLAVLNIAAMLSFALTVLGLLSALTGSAFGHAAHPYSKYLPWELPRYY